MEENVGDVASTLSPREASDTVSCLGWRYVLGLLRTSVRVQSLAQAIEVATRAVAASGPNTDDHLWVDVRRDRVVLTLQSLATASVTPQDLELARRIATVVRELGRTLDAEVGGDAPRSVQVLEIAIDALDIASIRPFWKAVMGYADEAGKAGPEDGLVDPGRAGSGDLVSADGRAASPTQPDPPRHLRPA